MRLKALFWILFTLVFGLLITVGFLYARSDFKIFVLIEGITLLALVLFILFYNLLLKPFRTISNGMDLLKQQDFSSRLRPVGHEETDRLIAIFNKMMNQLKEERLHVREQNRFLDLLIQASPLGLIILDFDEKISRINPAGLRLLNLDSENTVLGKRLDESGIEIGKSLASLKSNEDIILRISGITLYRCFRSSFIDKGFSRPFILIEELTYEALKIEKKSYENIIRMMAHEVNNSVAAVGSTLTIISDTLKQHENNELSDVLPAVEASFERCNHLSRFITNFANVVKIPPPILSKTDLNRLAYSVEALCNSECNLRNIRLTLLLSENPVILKMDGIQMEQVLVNLVKNAYESIGTNGKIRIITQSFPPQLTVEDTGPGINEEVKEKLFTPFFTTKPQGQGIGLMFVREVLINHGCKFTFGTQEPGITRFCISLPER
ncbi:MAG: ATP-binding protein [Candidatus Azobacteroides sp.]|nr:ATP-binding protein [Candidatus Azobacteroides sp.]